MKIAEIKITPLYIPFDGDLLWAWGSQSGCRRILVEVRTDDGYVGLGEANGYPARLAALEHIKPLVIGEDPFHTELIRSKCPPAFFHGNAYRHAYAAIEFACLDIQGQVIGRPLYDLFGGKVRNEIPVSLYVMPHYADASGKNELITPAQAVAFAQSMIDAHGFGTLKLKGGIFPPDDEFAVLAALRKAFPKHNLRIDPNGVWSVATSIRMALRARELDLEYLEDPTLGVRGMARVNEKAPGVPLATNMCILSFEDIVGGSMLDSVDVILFDPHWYGGIRTTTQLAKLCETLNFDMSMHSGNELGVSMAVELHSAALLPNLSHAIDQVYSHLTDDILVGGKLQISNGKMKVPDGPGLGIKIDQQKVGKYHEEFLRHGLELPPDKMTLPSAVRTLPRF